MIWRKVKLRWNEASFDDVFVSCGDIPLMPNRNGWPNDAGGGFLDNSASLNFHQSHLTSMNVFEKKKTTANAQKAN